MVHKNQAGNQVGRERAVYFGNIEPVGEWYGKRQSQRVPGPRTGWPAILVSGSYSLPWSLERRTALDGPGLFSIVDALIELWSQDRCLQRLYC